MADATLNGSKEETWYRLSPAQVAEKLGVDPAKGLSAAEAQSRLSTYGPNQMAAAKKEPGWKAFLRQYQDLMQMVLLGAGIINQIVTHDLGTTLVLIGLTAGQRRDGLAPGGEGRGEPGRAPGDDEERSPACAATASRSRSTPRRSCPATSCSWRPATSCRPTAGLFVAATVEIEEGALTGESVPVSKDVATIDQAGGPAGRPRLHGLHEHLGHARPRRDDRHRHRHEHRDRSHRRDAQRDRDGQDAAAEEARRADEDHHRHRRPGAGADRRRSGWRAVSRSTNSSSPASRWRSPPSRPVCRRW